MNENLREKARAVDRLKSFARLTLRKLPAQSEADWARVDEQVRAAFGQDRRKLAGALARLIKRHGSAVATRVCEALPLIGGQTAMERCVFEGEDDAFDTLLPHVAEHRRDEEGATLLMRALERSNVQYVKKLLPISDLSAARQARGHGGQKKGEIGVFAMAGYWMVHRIAMRKENGALLIAELAEESAKRPSEEARALLLQALQTLDWLASDPKNGRPEKGNPGRDTAELLVEHKTLERCLPLIERALATEGGIAANIGEKSPSRALFLPWIEAGELRRVVSGNPGAAQAERGPVARRASGRL